MLDVVGKKNPPKTPNYSTCTREEKLLVKSSCTNASRSSLTRRWEKEALVTKEPFTCCTVLQATGNKSLLHRYDRQACQACLYYPSRNIPVRRVWRVETWTKDVVDAVLKPLGQVHKSEGERV
jgi:hypothetical protein